MLETRNPLPSRVQGLLGTYQGAVESIRPDLDPAARPFSFVILGAGMFGSILAEHLFRLDRAKRHRILLLEGGPFLFDDHVQNLVPLVSEAYFKEHESFPWQSSAGLKLAGLLEGLGGRSLVWGAWSPEPLTTELSEWPGDVRVDLYSRYLAQARRLLGVGDRRFTGSLHEHLRNRLFDALAAHRIRYLTPVAKPEDLDAPVAQRSEPLRPRIFSAMPLLLKAAEDAERECAGDAVRKRLVILPNCRVLRLKHQQGRVCAVETDQGKIDIPPDGIVIAALGTIESTRLAMEAFPAEPLLGCNLMGHVLSDVTCRLPRAHLPVQGDRLQISSLLLRGRSGRSHFHVQLVAAVVGKEQTGLEEELRRELAGPGGVNIFNGITAEHIMVSLIGLGETQGVRNTSAGSRVTLDAPAASGAVPSARVHFQLSESDRQLWDVVDDVTDDICRLLGSGTRLEYRLPDQSRACWQAAMRFHEPVEAGGRRLSIVVHEAGTLWMGRSPADSVTSSFGRLHASPNTYIANPALFPTLGSHNGTLTGIALTLRMGDALLESRES
jgi:choline dehydrogenase-like flavoprotein